MNEDDASARGIATGDRVVVSSQTGTLTGLARADDRIGIGAVSIPHGFDRMNVQLLTNSSMVDELTGMPRYVGLEIEVRLRGPEE